MPHISVFHLSELEAQQLLVNTEQSFCDHIKWEIFNQFVLVHSELALLHLVHVVRQVPGVDLPIKLVALHQAFPLL